jgi:hypothetical protein
VFFVDAVNCICTCLLFVLLVATFSLLPLDRFPLIFSRLGTYYIRDACSQSNLYEDRMSERNSACA